MVMVVYRHQPFFLGKRGVIHDVAVEHVSVGDRYFLILECAHARGEQAFLDDGSCHITDFDHIANAKSAGVGLDDTSDDIGDGSGRGECEE